MCHFSGYCLLILCIQMKMIRYDSYRVPPFGYLRIFVLINSPELFADIRVLLRLLMPRHPSAALSSLITYDLLCSLPTSLFSIFVKNLLSQALFLICENFTFLLRFLFFVFIPVKIASCSFKEHVRLPRLELGTSTLSVSRSNQLSYNRIIWRLGDSNS